MMFAQSEDVLKIEWLWKATYEPSVRSVSW